MELFHVKHYCECVMRFEVQLLPQGSGRWAALLVGGSVILTDCRRPRVEVAQALLASGADPRSMMVIRAGAEIVACDTLGRASGKPVLCGDDESQTIQPDRSASCCYC